MLSATGRPVSVSDRLELESAVDGTAYNLTVDGVHTYFVLVGDEFVLVHNECELGVFVPSPKHHPNSPPLVSASAPPTVRPRWKCPFKSNPPPRAA